MEEKGGGANKIQGQLILVVLFYYSIDVDNFRHKASKKEKNNQNE